MSSMLAAWRHTVEDSGNLFGLLGNQWLEAVTRGGKGEYTQALHLLEAVVKTARRIGDQFWRVRVLNTLGWIYGELYDYEQSILWNTEGITAAQAANFPDPEVESNARLNLGDTLMALGRLDEAEMQFQKVERVARGRRVEHDQVVEL